MAIDRPTFTPTRIRAGYDRGQVDVAVDRIVGELSHPQPSMHVDEVDQLRFGARMYQPGYDITEVDDWLEEVAVGLGGRARTTGGASPADPAPMDDTDLDSAWARWVVTVAVVAALALIFYVTFA